MIVIGGIGSIRGAFLAALLVGLVDTLGRSFTVDILRLFLAPSPARTVGPALASMVIYLLMAVVLYCPPVRPVPGEGASRCRRRFRSRHRRWHAARSPRAAAGAVADRHLPRARRTAGGGAVRGAASYLLSLGSRVMIFAIAALALDLLVGYGALVSFGHAAFIGHRRLCGRHPRRHGIGDALVSLPVALAVSALFAFLTGIVCLRTRASTSS